jgi:PAS domain S-box-containing protein
MELRILCKSGAIKTILHGGVILPEAGRGIATFTDLTYREHNALRPPSNERKAQETEAVCRMLVSSSNPGDDNLLRLSPWEALIGERHRQREALRLSEELLDRTGRLAGVGGWDVNLLTGVVSWTAETRRLHAVPQDYRPTLESGIDFYTPESRPIIRRAVENAIATGAGWDVEASLIRGDGERIWVRVLGSVEFADGKPVRLIGAFQDITIRIAERNALKLANERLVLATASGHIATWDWDIANQRVFWDDRMYRMYGLDPSRQNGSYEIWARRVHPEDLHAAETVLAAAVRTAMHYEDEFRVVWDDGSVHQIRAMGQATHDQQGRPIRFVGVNWDVTEMRRLARERVEHAELFRVTLESIGDGVITTDAHARVRWMNSIAERLTGWTSSQAVGLPLTTIFKLIHEETRQPVQVPLAQCLAHGQALTIIRKTLLIARNGTEIGIDKSVAPIRDERGNVLGVVLVFHDVTEQRRLAREAARMLQLDLQMKDDFLSHVSHELRSPLASIYSFAGILADGLAGDLNPSQHEYLDIILRNSRQLRSMIDDLLQVTRSETGKLSIALEKTSLHEALQDALNTLRGAAEAKSVALACNSPGYLPPAFADPTRLRQILIIILDNAVKFTPPGGSVTVDTDVCLFEPEILQIRVTDTGPGIGQDAAERIFEHLYQVDEPGREGRNGLGLGLYIARDLVNRQGGKIWVDSGLGEGSEFSFTIPVYTAHAAAQPTNPWGGVERRKTEVPSPPTNALLKASR